VHDYCTTRHISNLIARVGVPISAQIQADSGLFGVTCVVAMEKQRNTRPGSGLRGQGRSQVRTSWRWMYDNFHQKKRNIVIWGNTPETPQCGCSDLNSTGVILPRHFAHSKHPVTRRQSRKSKDLHHQGVGTGIFLSGLLLSGSHEGIELLEGENKKENGVE
jgi:hypothetical protein